MTGDELKAIRKDLGLTQGEFLRAVGMLNKNSDVIQRLNAKSKLRKLEAPGAAVPPALADKANDLWLRRGGCGS